MSVFFWDSVRPGDVRLFAPQLKARAPTSFIANSQDMCHSASIKEPPRLQMDCVFYLWLTVFCGPPLILRGEQSLGCIQFGWNRECRKLLRTPISARAAGENKIQPSRYPCMYRQAYLPRHLNYAVSHLWESEGPVIQTFLNSVI